MNINDLVKLVNSPGFQPISQSDTGIGIIMDCLEMEDGFNEYEVLLSDGEIIWCSGLMLEVVQK